MSNTVPASHEIQLKVSGVTNPPADNGVINVATSAQAGANTNAYAISSPVAVSGASVGLSSSVQGEKGVTYTFGFTTSSTGGLASDEGTITLSAPAETVLSSSSLQIFDVTDDQSLSRGSPSPSGNSRTWTAGGPIAPATRSASP